MAYASGTDLLDRYDAGLVCDLAGDGVSKTLPGDVPTNARVVAALDDASGMIDAALQAGERYTPADLEGLSGHNLALLKRIACAIAFHLLLSGRPDVGRESKAHERAYEAAAEWLERLRTGQAVFTLDAQKDAGVLGTAGGLSAVEYQRSGLIVSRAQGHYFPMPQRRFPS